MRTLSSSSSSSSWKGGYSLFHLVIVACCAASLISFILINALWQSPSSSSSSHVSEHAQESHARVNYLLRTQIDSLQRELADTRALLGHVASIPYQPEPQEGVDWSKKKDAENADDENDEEHQHERTLGGRGARTASVGAAGVFSRPDHEPIPEHASAAGEDRATAAMKSYVSLHNSILSGSASTRSQFVIARPQAQMNNRLRVIVSALVLGMITRRAVLVEFSSGYYADLTDMFDMPIQIDIKHFKGKIGGGAQTLSFNDVNTLLCDDYNTLFKDVDSLNIESPPSLIPFFVRNPHHRPQLLQWFGQEEAIYKRVAEFFLKPSKVVESMVKQFQEENFRNSYVIGIHLRWGGDHRPQPVPQQEWDDLLSCVSAVSPRSLLPFKEKPNLVIYVAADTPESRVRSKELLSSYPIRNGLYKDVKLVYFGEWLRSNNAQGVQAALAELLILSQCDTLILTPHSSYGEQAMALNGKPGYYIRSDVPEKARISYNLKYMEPFANGNCMRTHTSQPSIENFNDMISQTKCYHPDMYTIYF